MLQTEYEFTLPFGYVGEDGSLHRDGTMRLATALDEVDAMRDPRVRANEAYLSILLLSRVVTRLGSYEPATPEVIGRLFSADFIYLQQLFVQLNDEGGSVIETECPSCGTRFPIDTAQAVTT
ncbi:MAG TPA: hypothetical protein VH680_01275 [Gemmatimonadales bacterium]|jgi:hypothetical protein